MTEWLGLLPPTSRWPEGPGVGLRDIRFAWQLIAGSIRYPFHVRKGISD